MHKIAHTERRHSSKALHEIWESLNAAQKLAIIELQRYGYQLRFVRQIPTGQLAILELADKCAAIDDTGQIDIAPSVTLRH